MSLVSQLLAASALAASAGPTTHTLPVRSDVPDPSRPCVQSLEDGLREPKDLDALLDCQFEFRQAWVRRYVKQKGRQPPDAALDRFDDLQRSEARDYLLRHPDRAQTSMPEPRGGKSRRAARKSRTASPGAEAPLPAAKCRDIRDLGDEMKRRSDGGRLGVTPAAARSVLDFLDCQQGGASPEMRRLLDSVAADGVSLRHSTVLQLKRASREAKANGLNLGVDAGLEKWLLDPSTDPEVGADDLVDDRLSAP